MNPSLEASAKTSMFLTTPGKNLFRSCLRTYSRIHPAHAPPRMPVLGVGNRYDFGVYQIGEDQPRS